MAPRRLVLYPAGVAVLLWVLNANWAPAPLQHVIAVPLEAPEERARAPAPQETLSDVVGTLGDEVAERRTAAAAAAAAAPIRCSLYAGPLRWQGKPAGVGAHTQVLRGVASAPSPVELRPIRRALEPFSLRSVRLLDDARDPLAVAASTNTAFLKQLDLARLLYSFRRCAGLAQPTARTVPYGGWERPSAGIRGHFMGHYLGALASGGAGGDASLVARARALLDGLVACQRAHSAHGQLGYLAAFPPSEFEKTERLWRDGPTWVPHYATQKLLSGLLLVHTELQLEAALPLALGMAEYVWKRTADLRRRAASDWYELLNYEVGALSEVYATIAALTHNASWLDAASLFDRRCFTGTLALAGALHLPSADEHGLVGSPGVRSATSATFGAATRGSGAPDAPVAPDAASAWTQSPDEAVAAAASLRGMHANAQLAYVMGEAARYEVTSDPISRLAVDAFWRALQRGFVYLSGGSSWQEQWSSSQEPPAAALAATLVHHGASNWQVDDCV
jgi:hypothetical protein